MRVSALIIASLLSLAAQGASCYETCKGASPCLNACYPEIIRFCEGRFPKADKQSPAYKRAMSDCIKYSHPCQDKCESADKSKEQSCRNECLGN